jgi:hypothetical protein
MIAGLISESQPVSQGTVKPPGLHVFQGYVQLDTQQGSRRNSPIHLDFRAMPTRVSEVDGFAEPLGAIGYPTVLHIPDISQAIARREPPL